MSGWIMWVVNGIFENVGTVQDGITTISQPRTVQDREGAMPLEVTNGAVHFDRIHFHYGKQGGVITGLDLAVRAGEKIGVVGPSGAGKRSEEHTSELQSLMRISYAVFCLKKKNNNHNQSHT